MVLSSDPLQGVGDRCRRDRRPTLRGRSRTAIEKLRLGQRTRPVVDDHDLDPFRQRRQSRPTESCRRSPPATIAWTLVKPSLRTSRPTASRVCDPATTTTGPIVSACSSARSDQASIGRPASGRTLSPAYQGAHLARQLPPPQPRAPARKRCHPGLESPFPGPTGESPLSAGQESPGARRSAAAAASGTGAEPSSRAARRSGPW